MKPEKLTVEEIKLISLQGLKKFHDYCEKNNLRYYLCYGTLLGAVRHKGFIPWDDDIDVVMPRSDYDALISQKKLIDSENWELLSINSEKKYKFPFAKFCNKDTVYLPSRFKSGLLYGIPIDIFPIDLVSDAYEADELSKKLLRHLISGRVIFNFDEKIDFIQFCVIYIKSFIKCLLFGTYNNQHIRFHKKMLTKKKGKFYKCFFAPTKDLWSVEWFGNPKKIQFENEFFNAPSDYDQVLKTTYGDYMKLPPEEERHYTHEIEAYIK